MRTAIVHLGTHKAASTSIQLHLARNRAGLRARGVCYPTPPPPTPFAHHGLAWQAINRHRGFERRPGNYSLSQALAESHESGCHMLMLSSEDFLWWADFDDYLEDFFNDLAREFERVVVTAFVRDRRGFFGSSYNQWVKSLVFAGDFDQYLDRVLRNQQAEMHYTRSLDRWGRQADEAVFLPFRPGLLRQPIEVHFLQALGVDGTGLHAPAETPANASIGPPSVVAFRRLGQLLGQRDWFRPFELEKRRLVTDFLQAATDELGWNTEPFRVFDAGRLARVRAAFHDEDRAFASRYFDGDWDEVFAAECNPDTVTEQDYAELEPRQRTLVDDLVARGMDLAQSSYLAPPGSGR